MGAAGCRAEGCCAARAEPSAEGECAAVPVLDAPALVGTARGAPRCGAPAGAAGTAAARLRAHGAERLEASWALLGQEFEVQCRVWESLGFSRGARHQGEVAMLQSKVEFAIGARGRNPAMAVEALELALQRNSQDVQLMSKDMAALLEGTVRSERLARACCELAERLESMSAAGPSGRPEPASLEALLASCELEHPKLEAFVRRAMGAGGAG